MTNESDSDEPADSSSSYRNKIILKVQSMMELLEVHSIMELQKMQERKKTPGFEMFLASGGFFGTAVLFRKKRKARKKRKGKDLN